MQAVYTARKIRPVLILLDLKLKYRSGLEVATELKRRVETSGIPMIAMSGFYPEERRNWLKRFCGISVFLKKPIDPTDLITEIERLLKEKNGKVDDIERRVL
jgi:DNA-binding response OmpR family regulator